MTTTPEYDALRAKVNEMFPERLKLDIGVELYHDRFTDVINDAQGTGNGGVWKYWTRIKGYKFYDDQTKDGKAYHGALTHDGEWWEILGKPLTIADVLRALAIVRKDKTLGIDAAGEMVIQPTYEEARAGGTRIRIQFTLSLPLSANENAAACEAVASLLADSK